MQEKRWYMSADGIERLRLLLRYDDETGKLFWNERPAGFHPSPRTLNSWNTKYSGKEALTAKGKSGHMYGSVMNDDLLAHKVVWAIFYGEWPEFEIDHADRDPTNNKISNLRAASRQENCRNTGKRQGKTSQHKGVFWDKSRGKWRSEIRDFDKRIHLGRFSSEAEAAEAYRTAAIRMFGEYAPDFLRVA